MLAIMVRFTVAILFAMLNAVALADDTDPSMVVNHFVQHFAVNKDGSYVLTVDQTKTIVLQRAVQEHAQYYIGYNRTLDEIGPIEAHTRKPDGRRVQVQAFHIKDQQEAASADAPMFQDTRVKIIVFPEVEVGDQLVVRYTLRRHTALFPGHFEDLTAPQFFAHGRFDLVYDMPADMPLHADSIGFAAFPATWHAGKRRYHWRYQNGPHARTEADSVSYLDYGKRLAVSTFASHAHFARAYAARASPQAQVTPAIAQLAARLTPGISSMRERALAIADWVRSHIRYVAVYVGPGGVVPHAAGTVLANRYGDCKDHAVLLEALLRAEGIDSSAALLNNGNSYRLPSVPTLGVVNHVITFIPALDLYVDSTAEAIAPGFLPSSLLDKPVLLAATGEFARTPSHQLERQHTVTRFVIDAEGRSRFSVVRSNRGAMAEPYRQAVRDTGPAERTQLVQSLLQGFGLKGRGTLDPGHMHGSGDEYRIRLSGSSEHVADLPGPSGVATNFDFWGGLGAAVSALGAESERTQDFVCPAIDSDEELVLAFPDKVSILATPRNLTLRQGPLAYSARYVSKGNTVTVHRTLAFRHSGIVCTPRDYDKMKPMIAYMLRDLRSQVVVQGQ
jgi:hypothetical protein